MTGIDAPASTSSIIESIRFTKVPGSCENGDDHSRCVIEWTDETGHRHATHVFWCPHPFCDITPFRFSDSPAHVLAAQWVGLASPVATAYLLLVYPTGELPRVEARVGIRSQWQNPQWGNTGGLLTERYFAESGPGVYPAPIVELDR